MEMTVHVSGGQIEKTEIVSEHEVKITLTAEDNTVKRLEDEEKPTIIEDKFRLVPASKLSLNDYFLQWRPETDNQRVFKTRLVKAINGGLDDFYCPIYDPSVDINGDIVFVRGTKPATDLTWDWWKSAVRKMGKVSDMKFRNGMKSEYDAFIGCLMKQLLNNGWRLEDVWKVVCDRSADLGNYIDSENNSVDFELTGSREICGWYDLGNTSKLLTYDEDERPNIFWIAGGCCCNYSYKHPLTSLVESYKPLMFMRHCVGWLVLSDY